MPCLPAHLPGFRQKRGPFTSTPLLQLPRVRPLPCTWPAGLTLVRANHVFLLEPALEPAIEQQAIARVHRIGQQRWAVLMRNK